MTLVNPATVRASRAKQHFVSADLQKRDLEKSVAASDDALLRRWERIAGEIARG